MLIVIPADIGYNEEYPSTTNESRHDTRNRTYAAECDFANNLNNLANTDAIYCNNGRIDAEKHGVSPGIKGGCICEHCVSPERPISSSKTSLSGTEKVKGDCELIVTVVYVGHRRSNARQPLDLFGIMAIFPGE